MIYHPQSAGVDLDTAYLAAQGISILFANDKNTALGLLKKKEIATVLTVHQPPYEYESSFFRIIMQQHPMIQRILLSAVLNKELMETAVNKTHINYFIFLPAAIENICLIIKKSFKRYNDISRPYKRISELEENVAKYHHQAQTDPLTRLLNRTAYNKITDQAVKLYQTNRDPFSLVMLDLDHFKQLNDQYGHPAGDKVLSTFSELIRRNTRSEDYAFRYGGEEFTIITQLASLESVKNFIERLLQQTRATTVLYEKQQIRFTFSAGIAPMEKKINRQELTRRADAAMYAAKRQGRDRILIFEPAMMEEYNKYQKN